MEERDKALLIYRAISENDFEYFLKEIDNFNLNWLNCFITDPAFLEEFHLVYPLDLAIEVGNERIVTKLLEMGENPNKNNFFERAIRKGDRNIVQLLIEAGAEIQITNNEILSLAAERGNLDIVKLLIERGVDTNGYDDDYLWVHPLVKAIANGHIEIYQYLIDLIHKQKDILNTIAMQELAKVGDIQTLGFLLDNGLDLNLKDRFWGGTVLMFAVEANQWNMIDYLIGMGANVNLQNFEGQTALMSSVTQSSITMVKKLLAAGSSKDIKDNNGNTALDLAIERKDKVIANLLQSN